MAEIEFDDVVKRYPDGFEAVKHMNLQIRDAEFAQALPTAQARHLSTEKAWHVIDYILGRARFPVQIVYGEEDLPGIADDDWSYGPPSYLTPDRVRVTGIKCTSFPSSPPPSRPA